MKMGSLSMSRRYVIAFGGLSVGKHEYEYHLNDKFFESLEYSEIQKGDVRVDVKLNKQDLMLIFDFAIRGTVTFPCDRCNDDFNISVRGEYSMAVKLGGDDALGEDVVVLPSTEGNIDMTQYLYEYTMLSLPVRRVHEHEEDCNQDALNKLKEIEVSDKEQEVDPRWAALKNIKFNN